jgi:uridine kinase
MSKNPPSMLFVDGIDGSGKSTLAENLRASLATEGVGATLFHVDDFRKPVDWAASGNTQADAYYNDYYDLLTLELVLEEVVRGATEVRVPVFTEAQPRTWSVLEVPRCDLVIVEGVFTQRIANATGAGLVYVDLAWQAARERILARDQAKGRTPAEIEARIDGRYFPGQRRYEAQCAPRKKAHWLASFCEQQGATPMKVQRTKLALPWPPTLAEQVSLHLSHLGQSTAIDSANG